MSHILLNYAFLLFWSNFGEIHRELFFLYIKVTISEKCTKIVWKFVFLPCLKGANPEKNLDLFKQLFLIKPLIKPLKGTNINKNFFPLKLSHIQLNCAFLLFWNILGEIHWILLVLFKNVTLLKCSSELLWKITFPNKIEKEKI